MKGHIKEFKQKLSALCKEYSIRIDSDLMYPEVTALRLVHTTPSSTTVHYLEEVTDKGKIRNKNF